MAKANRYFSLEKKENMSRVKTEYWADKRRSFQAGVVLEVLEVLESRKRENVSYIPIPVEGQMDPETRIIAKLKNARPGVPSLAVIIDGQTCFLLIKRETGKLSQAQRELREEIEAAGGVWVVAKGLDAALKTLEEWGAITPNTDGASD